MDVLMNRDEEVYQSELYTQQEHEGLNQEIAHILSKIRRYYGITQIRPPQLLSSLNRNSLFDNHMLDDLHTKLFNFKKKSHETFLKINALTSCLPYVSEEALIDSAYVLYRDFLHAQGAAKSALSKNKIQASMVRKLIKMMTNFEFALGKLSDDIAQKGISSLAFSLTRHMDLLSSYYEQLYKQQYIGNKYDSFGFWYTCKKLTRSSSRKEEIDFLSKTISTHQHCTESIRLHAVYLIISKIMATQPHQSLLLKLLNTVLKCSVVLDNKSMSAFEVNHFCEEHSLSVPAALLTHIHKELNSDSAFEESLFASSCFKEI
jgi:hypothetical protein